MEISIENSLSYEHKRGATSEAILNFSPTRHHISKNIEMLGEGGMRDRILARLRSRNRRVPQLRKNTK